jgi:hypothetical protein
MPSTRSPLPLALPFGVVGLSAGFALEALSRESGVGTCVAIVLLTALFAVGLGRFLAARAAAEAPWLHVLVGVPVAGAIEGALLTVAVWGPSHQTFLGGSARDGVLLGAVWGATLASPFVPAFVAVVYAARRIGTARAGSLIDGAHRRGVWVAAAAWSAATIIVSFAAWHAIEAEAVLVASSGCALVLAIAFFVNVDAMVKLVRYRAPRGARAAATPLVIDYGVGDEVEQREHAAAAAYRESARAVIVFRGTRGRALRALFFATAASGLSFALVLGSSIFAFVR